MRDSIKVGYDIARPIVIWKDHDTIVDGHHRYKLCKELNVEPSFTEKQFDSIYHAIRYVRKTYGTGRSRTETQKAENEVQLSLNDEKIAALERKLSTLKQGSERQIPDSLHGGQRELEMGKTSQKIAEKAGVGRATVDRVIKVHKDGVPELQDMMTSGVLTARAAETFVKKIPREEQKIIVGKGADAVIDKVIEIRAEEKEDIRLRKLEESRKEEQKELREYREVLQEQFGDSKYACGLSPSNMMWCNDCKAAFDVYKPNMGKVCPVCKSENIVFRDDSWYPGKKVI